MNHKERMKTLTARGWTCDYPNAVHPINVDKISYRCVWCVGPMPGFSELQAVYLDVEDGNVFLTGREHKDYSWDEFLAELDRKPEAAKPLAGQRSLWGDEE
jgi:hypothetical protein